jgi:hypothetical protein
VGVNVKYWARPDIINRIEEGRIKAYFKAEITDHRIALLPGKYKIVFRSLSANKYLYTKEKSFTIKSGKSEMIKIY